jgi:2-amino-4-hydroxy-6-hydroxymethyldihydropteridine diphosphokinase
VQSKSLSTARFEPDEMAVVAVGGNLCGPYPSSRALLEAAIDQFAAVGLPTVGRSRWWRSAAWPDPTGPAYLNGVVLVEPALEPAALLRALLDLETAFGRNRGARNASRTLDLDLIASGRRVLETPDLVLPHPRAHERLFVMGPLAEIAPDWRHPTLGRTAADLAEQAPVGRDAAAI